MLNKNISGEKIKIARICSNYSQTDLARKLQLYGVEIDKHTISHIERGFRKVKDYELDCISGILSVSLDFLLVDLPNVNISVFSSRKYEPSHKIYLQVLKERRNICGLNIRKARKDKGLSVYDLAGVMHGIDHSYISIIENGLRAVYDYRIRQFSEALDVTCENLLALDAAMIT